MRKNSICVNLILAMTLCMNLIFMMPGQLVQVNAAGLKNEQLDISKDMSIMVDANEGAQKYLDSLVHGEGTILYDLYKVGEVSEENGKPVYKLIGKYQSLQSDFDTMDWNEAAQKAMVMSIGDEGSLVNAPQKADYVGCSLHEKMQVASGVYLLIARGSKEDVTIVSRVTTSDADLLNSNAISEGLATVTLLGINTFTVMPQLISVPNKMDEENEWLYHQNITLKMEADPATGSIEIEKTLVDYYGNAENATFVFQVDTLYPTEDKVFKSEVYSIQFNKAGTKKIRIDGLPLGAKIKIMEIYSGVNYTASIQAPDSINVVVAADQVPVAHFTNTYNGKKAGGGGVTNHFTYNVKDGVGEWNWSQEADNSTTSNGLKSKLLSQILKLIDDAKKNSGRDGV